MDANVTSRDHQDQEEYVLLDLDSVSESFDIPPNAKYVLTVCYLTYFLFIFFPRMFKLLMFRLFSFSLRKKLLLIKVSDLNLVNCSNIM